MQEFGVQIKGFGLQAGNLPEYNQLMHTIESEQQTSEQ